MNVNLSSTLDLQWKDVKYSMFEVSDVHVEQIIPEIQGLDKVPSDVRIETRGFIGYDKSSILQRSSAPFVGNKEIEQPIVQHRLYSQNKGSATVINSVVKMQLSSSRNIFDSYLAKRGEGASGVANFFHRTIRINDLCKRRMIGECIVFDRYMKRTIDDFHGTLMHCVRSICFAPSADIDYIYMLKMDHLADVFENVYHFLRYIGSGFGVEKFRDSSERCRCLYMMKAKGIEYIPIKPRWLSFRDIEEVTDLLEIEKRHDFTTKKEGEKLKMTTFDNVLVSPFNNLERVTSESILDNSDVSDISGFKLYLASSIFETTVSELGKVNSEELAQVSSMLHINLFDSSLLLGLVLCRKGMMTEEYVNYINGNEDDERSWKSSRMKGEEMESEEFSTKERMSSLHSANVALNSLEKCWRETFLHELAAYNNIAADVMISVVDAIIRSSCRRIFESSPSEVVNMCSTASPFLPCDKLLASVYVLSYLSVFGDKKSPSTTRYLKCLIAYISHVTDGISPLLSRESFSEARQMQKALKNIHASIEKGFKTITDSSNEDGIRELFIIFNSNRQNKTKKGTPNCLLSRTRFQSTSAPVLRVVLWEYNGRGDDVTSTPRRGKGG